MSQHDAERLRRVAEIGLRHAAAEATGPLEELMATLAPDPIYEFHPLGKGMRGTEIVRRFYTQFFERYLKINDGYRLIGEWVSHDGVAQEYDIWLRVDGQREHHRVLGILTPNEDGTLLTGERVFADDLYIRRLVGDEIFQELTPLEAAQPD
jgi:hypothetical protein